MFVKTFCISYFSFSSSLPQSLSCLLYLPLYYELSAILPSSGTILRNFKSNVTSQDVRISAFFAFSAIIWIFNDTRKNSYLNENERETITETLKINNLAAIKSGKMEITRKLSKKFAHKALKTCCSETG